MAERYTTVYKLDGMCYAESSPVLLSGGALLYDNLSRSLIAQLKFTNVSDKIIDSVRVELIARDADDGENRDAVEFVYKDLECERDNSFGAKTAIVMPDSAVRSFDVRVCSVTFRGGKVWDGSGLSFEKLSPPKKLEAALEDNDLAHQFRIVYGSDCVYMPSEDKDLWFCTCGALNNSSEAKCHCCRRVFSALNSIDISTLRSENDRRLENEKKHEEEEDEEIAEKRGKLKKVLFFVLPAVLIGIVAIALLAGNAARRNAFARAGELLENGMYDEAAAAYQQLGDYNGSAELALHEVPYRKALYVMQCAGKDDVDALVMLDMKRSELAEGESVSSALYRKASEMFKALDGYKDSAEQAANCDQAIESIRLSALEDSYRAAAALLAAKEYCQARDEFLTLGEYKDSAVMAQESIYRMAAALSELSENYQMEGVSCTLPLAAGEKSVFYIPQEIFKSVGAGVSSDLRAIFPTGGVEINFEAPSEGSEALPFEDALRDLFDSLGDYKNSAENVETPGESEEADRQSPAENTGSGEVFFKYCASGDLASGYQWLLDHRGQFEGCDMWISLLNLYLPFCGTWSFQQGDPVLIPSTINVNLPCNSFISVVKIAKDGTVRLCIYPEGNYDYAIEMSSEYVDDGTVRFTASPDGLFVYYGVINKAGEFNYSKYNLFSEKQNRDSCSYVKQ